MWFLYDLFLGLSTGSLAELKLLSGYWVKQSGRLFGYLLSFLFIIFNFSACGLRNEEHTEKSDLSIVSWNVQTFFDAVKDGFEYDEFRKSENWDKEMYLERLKRLCESLKKLDADVFVLQEIENEAVIHDISNMIGGANWDFSKNWNYSCFSKTDGSAIGCAVLSRFELLEMKVHDLDVKTSGNKQPSMRYLMEVKLDCGGQEMVLLVNHWKSKSGGAAETELWRDWQESVLAARLIELSLNDGGRLPLVVCGDFNRDIQEFVLSSKGGMRALDVVLRSAGFGKKNCIEVYSPWFSDDGNLSFETGSYYYKNKWEYIDHFFCNSAVQINEFGPCLNGPWITSGGIPFSFKIYKGNGYSDHLPLKCKIKFCSD
ncbi:MAG: endonuclease/exonuclease/phosphatase family protein [Treponema sp.]|nr:endonuclease/exonuclease/phosphatase family protein [Treponema sp.]